MANEERYREIAAATIEELLHSRTQEVATEIARRVAAEVPAASSDDPLSASMDAPAGNLIELRDGSLAIAATATQTETLEALIAAASAITPGCGLLILRGSQAVGWNSRGLVEGDRFKRVVLDCAHGTAAHVVSTIQPAEVAASELDKTFTAALGLQPQARLAILPVLLKDRVAALLVALVPHGSEMPALQILLQMAQFVIDLQAYRKAAPAPAPAPTATAQPTVPAKPPAAATATVAAQPAAAAPAPVESPKPAAAPPEPEPPHIPAPIVAAAVPVAAAAVAAVSQVVTSAPGVEHTKPAPPPPPPPPAPVHAPVDVVPVTVPVAAAPEYSLANAPEPHPVVEAAYEAPVIAPPQPPVPVPVTPYASSYTNPQMEQMVEAHASNAPQGEDSFYRSALATALEIEPGAARPDDGLAAAAAALRQSAAQVAMAQPSDEAHDKARRFAKLLVEEIKLYNQANGKFAEGRKRGDIYGVLREDIDKSRAAYQKRYGDSVSDVDYFSQELVRILADNNRAMLGPGYQG